MEKEMILIIGTIIVLLALQAQMAWTFLMLGSSEGPYSRRKRLLTLLFCTLGVIAISTYAFFKMEWWLIFFGFFGFLLPLGIVVMLVYFPIEEAISSRKYEREQRGSE